MSIARDGVERERCPRCGGYWDKWKQSTLPCHARCYFDAETQDRIYAARLADHRATYGVLAARFGTTASVIRASIVEAMRRAGKVVSPWGR